MSPPQLHAAILAIDCESEADRIARWISETVISRLRRRGVVLGLSGGVDSSLCAALAVRALGATRVFGLMMPEHDSSPESLTRATRVAEQLGIEHAVENISAALEALGCYRRRDEAIRAVVSAYGSGWKSKIAIAGGREGGFNYFKLVARSPHGEVCEARLPFREYLQLVAATSFKQRVRKTIEYYHADRLHYAVIGTPNRLEHDQGFFVKNGDGAADLKPIAHLYKTQVYQLAEHLGVPAEVRSRPPTTDTYSLPQSQEEFYFSLPYDRMDLCLYGKDHGVPVNDIARAAGLSPEQVQRVFRDIEQKRRSTEYLHAPPQLVQEIRHP